MSTLGAQTHGPMQRNAVEQLHVCVLLGPEPRRRKRERVVLCRSPGVQEGVRGGCASGDRPCGFAQLVSSGESESWGYCGQWLEVFSACACPVRLRSQRQDACRKRAPLLRGRADVFELFVADSCGL